MSKLNIDQKVVEALFNDKHADYLIPDYQRPYAWEEDECSTLWEDLFSFAFPGDDSDSFNRDTDEFFLGPIVTFKNENRKIEIIDGQQRMTTLLLMLRAFYERFGYQKDPNSKKMQERIAACLWKTDEFGNPDMTRLKIDSQVASDQDKNQFLRILETGVAPPEWKSTYAKNFRYFRDKIEETVLKYPSYISSFAARILGNVVLLPIEAASQDTALRIFSTLNDRGLPLSDADIFKSQFYKYYTELNQKDQFIERWKKLELIAKDVMKGQRFSPMDELFTRYMYYERARKGIRDTTTPSLRSFYGQDKYAMLKREETLSNLEALAEFWKQVEEQDETVFTPQVLRHLFVLNYAPNGMWKYVLSVYYLSNRDGQGKLDNGRLEGFLRLIADFVLAYAIERPGVNALRSPVYPEMINIVKGEPVTFREYRFVRDEIRNHFASFVFTNGRPVTRAMLAWWEFQNPDQKLLELEMKLEIEHIYPSRRAKTSPLGRPENIDALGNKALLEKTINIRASDYRFADKRNYYLHGGKDKKGTRNNELITLAASDRTDFTETDIESRTNLIIDAFMDELATVGLMR
ncbi:MAG: DUF262 domain-containing protein [Duodenibacillus sp.]|nr:DUF262 domain-containing protein [Duodenibacillus sp.]